LEEELAESLDLASAVPLEEELEEPLEKKTEVSLEEELEEPLEKKTEVPLEAELEDSLEKKTEASLEDEDELDLSLKALLEETTEETFEVMPDEFSEDTSGLYMEAAPEIATEAEPNVFSDGLPEGFLEDEVDEPADLEPLGQSGVSSASSVDVVPDSSADVATDHPVDVAPDSSEDVVRDSSVDVVPDDLPDVATGVSSDRAPLSLVVESNINSQDSKTTISDKTKSYEPTLESEDADNATELVHATGGAISGLITGICAVLLPVLAAAAFAPDILQTLLMKVSVVSTQYRLIMLLLVITFTTSFFLWVSKFVGTNENSAIPKLHVDTNSNFLSRLFDTGASPQRIVAGAMGPVFLGLGQGISISAGYGTFGLSVLLDGINKTFFMPFWFSHTILTMGCYLLAWLWGRVPLGLGTLAALLLIGPAISFGSVIVPQDLSLAENIAVFALGLFLFAFGIALAASAALGPDAFSSLSLAAERVNQWNFPLATLLWDITAITSGLILGGSVGIATAIGLLAVPLLLHLLIPPLRHVLH